MFQLTEILTGFVSAGKKYLNERERERERDRVTELWLHFCSSTDYSSLIRFSSNTVKILKFGTPQTIAIIVLKIEKFDVTLH